MNLANILREPGSWDEAYQGEKSLVRTTLFWACLPAFLNAVLATAGLAVHILLRVPGRATVIVPAMVMMEVFVLYNGWQFLGFVQEVRDLLPRAPDERGAILSLGRYTARLFIFAMTVIGMAMIIGLLLLSR